MTKHLRHALLAITLPRSWDGATAFYGTLALGPGKPIMVRMPTAYQQPDTDRPNDTVMTPS